MARRRPLPTLLAALAAPLLGACISHQPKVLVIGIDGLRPDQLLEAETPALDSLSARGTLDLDARNAWTPEEAWNGHSATNWGVLLTGVGPQRSGLTANGDTTHRIGDLAPDAVRTLFGHLKAADPSLETGAFHTWTGLGLEAGTILARSRTSLDLHFCPRSEASAAERDGETLAAALEALGGTGRFAGADPDVVFVHLDQVDSAGHTHTYDDPLYRAAIEAVDAQVAALLAALDARPNRIREDWLVLVSTDHGGESESMGHGDNSRPDTHTIPLLVCADGRDPAEDFGRRVSLYDVVPTVLSWMGVQRRAAELEGSSLLP